MYRLLNFGWRLMKDRGVRFPKAVSNMTQLSLESARSACMTGKLNMRVVIDRLCLASYLIDCARAHELKAQYECKESCFGKIMGVIGQVQGSSKMLPDAVDRVYNLVSRG